MLRVRSVAVVLVGLVSVLSFTFLPSSTADAVPPMIATREVPNAGPRPVCVSAAQSSLQQNGWGSIEVVHGAHVYGLAGDYRAGITCTAAQSAVVLVAGPDGTNLIPLVDAIANRM